MPTDETPAGRRASSRGCPLIAIATFLAIEAAVLCWLVALQTGSLVAAGLVGAALFTGTWLLIIRAGRDDLAWAATETAGHVARTFVERLQFAIDRHALVSESDVHGSITRVNDEFCATSGYSREELIGRNHRILASGAHAPDFFANLWRTILTGGVWKGEICNRRKDGTFFWVHVTIVPLPGSDGRPASFLAIQRDVTNERNLRDDLHAAHELLERSQAIARFGSWESDQATGRVTCSATALELLGVPAGAPLHLDDIVRFIAPEYHETFHAARNASISGHQPWDVEVELVTPQRRRFWVHSQGWPIIANGAVVKLVGTLHDIDERKRLAIALTDSNRQLEETATRAGQLAREAVVATEAKSMFLASISHEIRTPMNGMIGFTNLLQNTSLTADQRDYVRQIHTCGDALLDLLNDLLDYSKIEHGRLDLEQTPFDIREIVEAALDLLAPRAAEKSLDLVVDIAPDVPAGLVGDPGRLRQVLLNLINNAIKFTPAGEVFVGVARAPAAVAGRIALRFVIRDTGIGINAEAAHRLFQPFMQADASTTRRFGGTGLGLAICKRLLELMGGTIGFTSRPDKGSEFWFEVDLPAAELPPVATTTHTGSSMTGAGNPEALAGATVLIVDDNATNRRVLGAQLARWGMRCTLTASGAEALALHDGASRFDFALVDLVMPRMDGAAVARALRALGAQRQPRHIVLLSSLGTRLGAEVTALFAVCLAKPTRAGELLYHLVNLHTGAPQHPVPAAPREDFSALHVLVVEDNPINQRVIRLLLRKLGVEADIAHHGREAVACARRRAYDLVFMDLQMPEMDGFEATRTIRRDLPPEFQPMIVALTANAVIGDEADCLAAGMDAYLAKPARTPQLTDMLHRAALRAESAKAI